MRKLGLLRYKLEPRVLYSGYTHLFDLSVPLSMSMGDGWL